MITREKILNTLNGLHLLELQTPYHSVAERLRALRVSLEGDSTDLDWVEDKVGWYTSKYLDYGLTVRKDMGHKWVNWVITQGDRNRVVCMSDLNKPYSNFREIEQDMIATVDGLERR